jgi:outer membrane beta-barrel protein
LGLDLSNDEPPKEAKPGAKPGKEKDDAKHDGDDALSLKADRPSLDTAPETTEQKEKSALAATQGERDITQEDRVKAVQRKVYLRTGRFEFTPMVSASVNDPYYWKLAAALRAGYYIADTLAVSVRYGLTSVVGTDDARLAKQTFVARVLKSTPWWSATADLEWSPFYGKVAIFNSILHFDAYVMGGLGAVYTETSALPGRTANPAADLGGGLRFQIFDHLAAGVSVINTAYVDQPLGTNKSTTQNILGLYAGVSVFFPFRSTGREAE